MVKAISLERSQSGLPPGRTGIETTPLALLANSYCQDYPPAGLGLRPQTTLQRIPLGMSGLPPGRTGIETITAKLNGFNPILSGLPPGRTGIETFFASVE